MSFIMKNQFLAVLLFLFSSHSLQANIIFFDFGSNSAGATPWSYIGGGTNLDGLPAWKNSAAYIEAGWLTNRPSAFGFGSNPPVRNTVIPQDATAGGGGAAGARFSTLYFRKKINITNLNTFFNFRMQAKFDDAILVWVNGTLAYSNNITTPAAFATLASTPIANNGADIFTANLSPTLFLEGENLIAVEVHQNSATSSDLFFDMALEGVNTPEFSRSPYLQMGTTNSVVVRWRTNAPIASKVTWGLVNGVYPNEVLDATPKTEHALTITGLTADTKYFYTVGYDNTTLQQGSDSYFMTLPTSSSTRKIRIWGVGDCGNASANQIDTKNAFLQYIGTNYVDALLTFGDNAYNNGTDVEYQTNFFDIYKSDILKYYKLYPTPGNHDYGSTNANTAVRNNAYYNSFTLPTAGQIGGVASGTEAYYSFDIGNVHFLSLDSYGREDMNSTKLYDTSGAQTQWLKNDLAANTKKWTVVYFHHPPYTMTSHNSDTESGDLGRVREEFIRILERNGVDLVICGHSHGYERSYLLKNYYKANAAAPSLLEADFAAANHTATGNLQNGVYDGSGDNACAYAYKDGKFNHGSVYIVSGSAGQLGGTQAAYPHNAMHYSNATEGGSFYFEVDSNRLDAKFISYSGTGLSVAPVVRDQFTIFKDVKNRNAITAPRNSFVNLKASWRGNYYWPSLGGATTQTVRVPFTTAGTYQYIVQDASNNSCIADTFDVTITSALSIKLNSFNATLLPNGVKLNWSVNNVVPNTQFIIERSSDGFRFEPISTQSNVAFSNLKQFDHVDMQPLLGSNYYRLVIAEPAGKVSYSVVKKVIFKKDFGLLIAINNSAQNQVTVQIQSQSNHQVGLKIIDVDGKVLYQEYMKLNAGSSTRILSLLPGIKFAQLTFSDHSVITQKFVVK